MACHGVVEERAEPRVAAAEVPVVRAEGHGERRLVVCRGEPLGQVRGWRHAERGQLQPHQLLQAPAPAVVGQEQRGHRSEAVPAAVRLGEDARRGEHPHHAVQVGELAGCQGERGDQAVEGGVAAGATDGVCDAELDGAPEGHGLHVAQGVVRQINAGLQQLGAAVGRLGVGFLLHCFSHAAMGLGMLPL